LRPAVANARIEAMPSPRAFLRGRRSDLDRTTSNLYQHWILGGGAKGTQPRWSIMRDILHWGE
jgi:hypothetical protein